MRFAVIIFFLGILSFKAKAQCEVTATILPSNVVCGDCAFLTAFGQGQGNQVFSDNFNSGNFSSGWGSTVQAMFNNPCSPNGVDGTTHVWMGNSSPVPRFIRTQAYNLTPATAGVTICFDLLFAEQTGDAASAPCEGPDEPDEGVYLQYSTDGGNTWNTIHYFDPNGGHDPDLINWNNWCFQLPPGAITTQTQIRFFQDFDSGADYDHWGIDNFVIYYNDPTYNITWLHDNYSYGVGNSGGQNPNPVCPQSVTDYFVVMTNGINTCRDTVRVTVSLPTIEVNAGNDTTICAGECVTLNATAKVIKSPAKTPTYRNGEVTPIANIFGSVSSININITDLNMTTILPNSITRVCIEFLTFFGINIFPPGQQTIGDLLVRLVCPDGTKITLIPNGITTSTDPFTGYTNTCFDLSSTTSISSASLPYTGTFMPNQSLNGLVGCTANGVWSIELSPQSTLGLGGGAFYGWSITFDDPEISYTANFSWSPTTNMTNSNTLTPTVCPTATTAYTLTASDTAGCISSSDVVNVTVDQVCCQFNVSANVTPPSCSASDGAIDITFASTTPSYTVLWSNGASTLDISNVPAGTYALTIYVAPGCQYDTTIVLTSPNSPQITNIAVTGETCLGYNDGTATATASGGTGSLNYIWSNGQSGTGLTSVSGLAGGSYTVTVEDASFCFDVDSFAITPGIACCTLQISSSATPPACGSSDGSIMLTVTGSGNYSFNWSNGATTQNLSNVPAGSYSVTVNDISQNCQRDTVINLSNPNAPFISNMGSTAENCSGNNDGLATVVATGSGTLTYLWSNGETTITITNLAPGLYTVTVSDSNNCQAIGSIIVNAGPVCCALSSSVTVVDASCNGNDGTLTVDVTPGTGTMPFEYSIDGATFVTTNVFSNLSSGSYNVIARDANQCADTNAVVINQVGNTISLSVSPNDITCFGDDDGSASVSISGGNPPLSMVWSNGFTTDTISNLIAGTYYVTVTDSANCTRIDSAVITEPAPFTIDLGPDVNVCVDSLITLGAGVNAVTFNWTSGETSSTISPFQSGVYFLTATDQNNCVSIDSITVTINNLPTVDAGQDTTILDYETAQLFATGSGTNNPTQFLWKPSNSLSCSNCQSPIADPDSTTTYIVIYTDENNCEAIDEVTVTIEPAEFYAMIPNAFTPNGDGDNDVVVIFHKGVKQLTLKIFNRWGEKVFQTSDPNITWNGTHKGNLLTPDVLVYYLDVEFMNGYTKGTKGSLTLIR